MVYLGQKKHLSSIEYKPRSSSHHKEKFTKLCDKYQGNSKNNAIHCDGIDSEAFDVWLVDYMQMFNLPKLHLLLRIGQKLYDSILCTMSEEEKEFHEALLRKHNIQKSTYHGGAFEGNAMRKITKQATDLGFPKNNCSYITLLRFNAVVTTCFEKENTGDYKMVIFQFEEAFIQTGLPCSTKVHVVCRQLISFIMNNLPVGMGSGVVSEPGAESTHSRLGRVWETRYKCNEENVKYTKSLLNTVSEVNFVKQLLPKCNDRKKKTKRIFFTQKINQFHPKTGQFWHFFEVKNVVNCSNSSQQYSVNGKAKAKPLLYHCW